MGSVRKLLCIYGGVNKKYEAHKQNQNPAECRIQEIKCATRNSLYCSGEPIWYWILSMYYVISILNCMPHQSLSWRIPYKAEYGFTPDAAHLMEFKF